MSFAQKQQLATCYVCMYVTAQWKERTRLAIHLNCCQLQAIFGDVGHFSYVERSLSAVKLNHTHVWKIKCHSADCQHGCVCYWCQIWGLWMGTIRHRYVDNGQLHLPGSLSPSASVIHDKVIDEKGLLTSVLSFHCCVGLPLCWKTFSENTTPHQQHWANSVQKSPRQPLVHDWLATPETLMMLNRHRSKYRG